MLARSASVLLGVLAGCLSASSFAQAEPAWRVRHGNGQMWAEVASQTHGSTLSVQCDEANKSISLTVQPPASWNGNAGYKMNILVDDKPFAVMVDGIDNGVVLSNLAKDKIGIDRPLRHAMKAGHLLVLDGPPAAGIPGEQRSFSLDGASAAITRIESGCPGVR